MLHVNAMADHSTEIARIRRILSVGARSIDVDGQKTQIDLESLRKRLRELESQDDSLRGRRPVVSKMNLRN